MLMRILLSRKKYNTENKMPIKIPVHLAQIGNWYLKILMDLSQYVWQPKIKAKYGLLVIWSRIVTINNASDTTTEVIKNIEPFIFNLTCKNSIMIGMNDPMKYIQK